MNSVEQLKTTFNNDNTKLVLEEMKHKYNLNNIEYLNLVTIFMSYIIISKNPDIPNTCIFICTKILEYKETINKNMNGEIFKICLTHFISNEIDEEKDSEHRILRTIETGIFFHSFNPAFNSKINDQGLIIYDKPWNLEEIEEVRKIFKKYGISNIFGMYQGKMETPIFFANQLISSPYYGLSSPTFFRKFIENNTEYFNTFRDRDYLSAEESIIRLCMPLNDEEKKYVYSFFKKYWNYFASDELPSVAITTGEKLNYSKPLLKRFDNETSVEYILRCFLDQHNLMVRQDIPRENIEIFSYNELSFINLEKKKNI